MDIRFRLILVLGMALLVGAVWTLPRWWTSLNPESVLAEEMPGLSRPVQQQFVGLPDAQKNAYMAIFNGDKENSIEAQPDWARALVEARFLTEDIAADEATQPFELPAGSVVIATGEFNPIDIVRGAAGEITIYQLPDGSRLLRFSEDFKSTHAPDIRIILTRNPDPTDAQGVGIDYLEIAKLRGNVGAQNYVIPETADFNRYPIMALYSPKYDALIATLTIQ